MFKKSIYIIKTIFLLCIFGITLSVQATEFPSEPVSTVFVVDKAGMIDPAEHTSIDLLCLKLLEEKRVQMIVVTIPSLEAYDAGNYSVESYARELYKEWDLGSDHKNYGILLMVSAADRRVHIEFGEGLAGRYDRQVPGIIDDLILPAFEEGEYSQGILIGARAADALVRGLQLPQSATTVWLYPVLIGGSLLALAILALYLFN